MDFIVKDEELVIQFTPGNGAWTYQLIIPNTKEIKGKWGDLKVSGTIDGYPIENKNLGPVKNSDKKLALNSTIRNSINKGAGDKVRVTLSLQNQTNNQDNREIFECFSDAGVLPVFKKLNTSEQDELISTINEAATQDLKVEKILRVIDQLEKSKEYGWD